MAATTAVAKSSRIFSSKGYSARGQLLAGSRSRPTTTATVSRNVVRHISRPSAKQQSIGIHRQTGIETRSPSTATQELQTRLGISFAILLRYVVHDVDATNVSFHWSFHHRLRHAKPSASESHPSLAQSLHVGFRPDNPGQPDTTRRTSSRNESDTVTRATRGFGDSTKNVRVSASGIVSIQYAGADG